MATPSKNNEFERLIAEATAHVNAGRLDAAAHAYHAALGIAPGNAGVHHNLGVIAGRQGDPRAAIAFFDAALAAEPRYAAAHFGRARALEALDQRRAAIAGFTQAVALDPGHYESHRALGFAWLAEGDRGRALDHFARTYDLRRGDDRTGIAAKSLDHASRTKLAHDAAQFRHLAGGRRDPKRFETMARTYATAARAFPEAVTRLTDDDFDVLGQAYNTAIHIADAPEIRAGALAPRADAAMLSRQFKSGRSGAVFFDDLLSPTAFAAFRTYLLESTIWHDFSHIRGFVAAYLEDGLACPLLLQIADELRQAFPDLLGPHPLTQAWAFKAVTPDAAVDVHADDGAVSINFWMTPNEANLNQGRGGMAVCRVPPPAEWTMQGYDSDRDRGVSFLEQNRAETLIVPYRENRAVLFESRLIHASDAPKFSEDYINQRINVTFLYGHGPRH